MDGAAISPEHDEMVRSLARATRSELRLKVELADLVGYGVEGLLKAKKSFDPERGIRFEAYAYYRIRGAIRDGVRQLTPLPRRAHEALLQAEERADLAMEAAGERSAKEPTEGDFDAGATSIDELMGQVAASHIATAASNADATSEESLITQLDAVRLRKVIETLPQEARDLVRHLYFDDLGLEGAGAKLGMSKSSAFRLHGEVLALLRAKLS